MPKFYLNLEIDVDVDNKLYIVEDDGSYYVTPIESLDEVPQIVGNYIKENIEARKENQDA